MFSLNFGWTVESVPLSEPSPLGVFCKTQREFLLYFEISTYTEARVSIYITTIIIEHTGQCNHFQTSGEF